MLRLSSLELIGRWLVYHDNESFHQDLHCVITAEQAQ
jgi:hypothetical protein